MTLNTAAGAGSLTVDLDANLATIIDAAGNALAMGRAGDESYTVDRGAPEVTEITPVTTSPTNASLLAFTVVFSEPVTGFESAGDLALTFSGTAASTGVLIGGGPQTYTLEITGVSGDGEAQVSVSIVSDIADSAGNRLRPA